MTTKRAIEILNPEHRERYDSIEPVQEACRMGMQALEKQIPKKPLKCTYMPLIESGWETVCPTCKCAVGKNANTDYECLEEYQDFCGQCGQALDWE